MRSIKIVPALVACALAAQAWAAVEPNDRCKYVLAGAQQAHDKRLDEIKAREERLAQRAKESSSCLARAADSVARAAIPPSMGSILGVFSDPGGYMTAAMSNSACNVITGQAQQAVRGYGTINGIVVDASNQAQGAFRGQVDQAVGGHGQSYGPYSPEPKGQDDKTFYQSLSCRLFGRC